MQMTREYKANLTNSTGICFLSLSISNENHIDIGVIPIVFYNKSPCLIFPHGALGKITHLVILLKPNLYY